MPASFVFVYDCPVTQHYRQRRAWKVLLSSHYKRFARNSMCPYDWWATVKGKNGNTAIMLLFLLVYNILQSTLSKRIVRNTTAITAVTKSSIKPWPSTNTNCHLRDSGERNGAQRRTKVGFGRTMMWLTLSSEKIKLIALAVIELQYACLVR